MPSAFAVHTAPGVAGCGWCVAAACLASAAALLLERLVDAATVLVLGCLERFYATSYTRAQTSRCVRFSLIEERGRRPASCKNSRAVCIQVYIERVTHEVGLHCICRDTPDGERTLENKHWATRSFPHHHTDAVTERAAVPVPASNAVVF